MFGNGLANGWPLSYGQPRNTSLQTGWQHLRFPFHPITTLCYRSLTTRFITRSKPESDHISYMDYTLRNRWTHDSWKERVETWQLSTWATVCCTGAMNRRQPARHTSQQGPMHTARPHTQGQRWEDTRETQGLWKVRKILMLKTTEQRVVYLS